jgi:putative endonuclease
MSHISDKPYLVYILWSESGRLFYIGISEAPEHRLEQHNSESGQGWTRRHQPWVIVHTERYTTYGDARRRELDLKAQKGGVGFFAKTGLDALNFKRGS